MSPAPGAGEPRTHSGQQSPWAGSGVTAGVRDQAGSDIRGGRRDGHLDEATGWRPRGVQGASDQGRVGRSGARSLPMAQAVMSAPCLARDQANASPGSILRLLRGLCPLTRSVLPHHVSGWSVFLFCQEKGVKVALCPRRVSTSEGLACFCLPVAAPS